jgi:hypothetical protein
METIPTNNTKVIPMSQQSYENVANQGAKIGIVWISIGITSWAEAASFLAFVLSLLALCEYLWKKVVRPLLVRFGYMKPIKHKVKLVEVDSDE